ncbi:MAG TPA: extracellular solute-binding protein [Candidatus Acidoferrum sp.]|nr:extracellular solute-binding protein [Candidatus Acidoferrum sp.]
MNAARNPRLGWALGVLLLGLILGACRRSSPSPVTITFLDPEWSHDSSGRSEAREAELQEFTRETGIQVKHLPAPESSPDQLALIRQLLQKGTGSPDVYGIDVIWPGILRRYLADLKPYFTEETASDEPELVANYTVDGKLVAVPYHTNTGVLFYRADLLKEYGFRNPPTTWDQLEKMALRIQQGERAKGKKDFWGFVWPGAASEGLTCNALEWQFSAGGGRIIAGDRKITVNNPGTIRAWEHAAHWVGWISSPSVLSYQEWDAINAFQYSGTAAFWRGWTSDYFLSHPVISPTLHESGVTSVPGGSAGRVAVVGGFGLGVSHTSIHRAEAVTLVRFLVNKEHQDEAARSSAGPPQWPRLFDLPPVLRAYSRFGISNVGKRSGSVARPSTVTGENYERVSRAYFQTVYSVLSGKANARGAARALQKKLVAITGFKAGPVEKGGSER